jgi:hypothetical protein
MKSQKQLIEQRDWDILIILDACRYGFFEKNYENFLNGELSRIKSSGSITPRWFKNTFTEKFDNTTYISSNPFINSQVSIKGVDAPKYFPRIVDVWNSGWDDEIGTVKPEEINKAFLKEVDENPAEKYILHYMQPHQPYISTGGEKSWSGIIDRDSSGVNGKLDGIKLYIGDLIKLILGKKKYWQIRERLGALKNPMGKIVLDEGDDKLREVYEEDLKIVLEKVKEIVEDNKEKKIVVTADHGELLGKGEGYGHHPNRKDSELREVPWLKIN